MRNAEGAEWGRARGWRRVEGHWGRGFRKLLKVEQPVHQLACVMYCAAIPHDFNMFCGHVDVL